LTFDEEVSLGSTGILSIFINTSTCFKRFYLTSPTDRGAITLSEDKHTLSITLSDNIGYGIPVSIGIPSGFVMDIYGNNFAEIMPGSGTWDFTTIKGTQTINFPAITSKTYGDASFTLGDGTTDKGLAITYTAEDPSIVSISGNQATVLKAGTTTITASQAGNATYSAANVIQTLVVNRKNLTVTADAKTKVYGAANPTLTLSYNGWINSDNETVLETKPAAGTTVTQLTPAGTYTNAISVSGGLDDNYSFSYTAGAFSVTQAVLTVTVDAQSKTYGAANPTLTFGYSGWKNSDTETVLDTKPSASTSVTASSSVANYTGAITVSGGADNNYDFTYVAGAFTVTKATLTVTADAQTKVYGAANPTLTFKYSGWQNGDDADDLTTKPSATTTVSLTTPAGTNPSAITLAGGADENYDFSYVAASFTVTKATLTVTADAQTKVYGAANPTLTFRYSGWKNSDTETVLDTKPSASTSVTASSSVANYPGAITVSGGADNNYDFSYVAANFSVTKAFLTVTADEKTKVYGEKDPLFTFSIMSGTLFGTDKITGTLIRQEGEKIGNYVILIGSVSINDNYNLTYISKNFTINPLEVQVNADAKAKQYNASEPELTFTSLPDTGFVLPNGEIISFTGELSRVQGEEVGDYEILQNTLNNSNYTIIFKKAYLTITLATGIDKATPFKPDIKVYPNPFTDKVVFEMQMQSYCDVKLDVYSITGTRLASLVNKSLYGLQAIRIEYSPKNHSDNIQVYKLTINGVVTKTGILIHK